MSRAMREFDGVLIPSRMVKIFENYGFETIQDIIDFDNGEKEVFDRFDGKITKWSDFYNIGIGTMYELSDSLKNAGYGELKTITRSKFREDAYQQGRTDKLAEVKEVLATMVVNEVIDNFAYEHILVQIGAEQ